MGDHEKYPECDGMEYCFAADGRLLALVIRADFESYEQFPPFSQPEDKGGSIQTANDTKAFVTPYAFPLQITLLKRDPGSVVKPHVHKVLDLPTGGYGHQVMLALRGRVRIGVYTADNEHLADLFLEPGDLALLTEGHEVEFLEPNTKVVEIKQGPKPAAIADQMVALGS